ncbi:MAG: EsaB/YukD family protein [Eubacteriales bacterium]|nr:EsaB/YukD family protein [Eubacteriales bacterium]
MTSSYDIEVPTDVAVSRLSAHIAETINAYLSEQHPLKSAKYALRCQRLGRMLREEETLGAAGVWNGDILLLEKC